MGNMENVVFDYDDQEVKNCDKCGQEIFFVKTRAGKWMPVNFDDNKCHFNICPGADKDKDKKVIDICRKLGRVRQAAKNREPIKANKNQPLDEATELDWYRRYIDKITEHLGESKK